METILKSWLKDTLSNIYTIVFRVKRLNKRLFNRLTRKTVWSHALSHLGRWLLHGSLRVIKLQLIYNVCSISYLRVLFHSSGSINHKKIEGQECIHVTIYFVLCVYYSQVTIGLNLGQRYLNIYVKWDYYHLIYQHFIKHLLYCTLSILSTFDLIGS